MMAAVLLAMAFSSCFVLNAFLAPDSHDASQAAFNVSVGTPIEVPSPGAQGPPWVLGQWFHTRPLQRLSRALSSLASAYSLGVEVKQAAACSSAPTLGLATSSPAMGMCAQGACVRTIQCPSTLFSSHSVSHLDTGLVETARTLPCVPSYTALHLGRACGRSMLAVDLFPQGKTLPSSSSAVNLPSSSSAVDFSSAVNLADSCCSLLAGSSLAPGAPGVAFASMQFPAPGAPGVAFGDPRGDFGASLEDPRGDFGASLDFVLGNWIQSSPVQFMAETLSSWFSLEGGEGRREAMDLLNDEINDIWCLEGESAVPSGQHRDKLKFRAILSSQMNSAHLLWINALRVARQAMVKFSCIGTIVSAVSSCGDALAAIFFSTLRSAAFQGGVQLIQTAFRACRFSMYMSAPTVLISLSSGLDPSSWWLFLFIYCTIASISATSHGAARRDLAYRFNYVFAWSGWPRCFSADGFCSRIHVVAVAEVWVERLVSVMVLSLRSLQSASLPRFSFQLLSAPVSVSRRSFFHAMMLILLVVLVAVPCADAMEGGESGSSGSLTRCILRTLDYTAWMVFSSMLESYCRLGVQGDKCDKPFKYRHRHLYVREKALDSLRALDPPPADLAALVAAFKAFDNEAVAAYIENELAVLAPHFDSEDAEREWLKEADILYWRLVATTVHCHEAAVIVRKYAPGSSDVHPYAEGCEAMHELEALACGYGPGGESMEGNLTRLFNMDPSEASIQGLITEHFELVQRVNKNPDISIDTIMKHSLLRYIREHPDFASVHVAEEACAAKEVDYKTTVLRLK